MTEQNIEEISEATKENNEVEKTIEQKKRFLERLHLAAT